jgi:hypothetical protein
VRGGAAVDGGGGGKMVWNSDSGIRRQPDLKVVPRRAVWGCPKSIVSFS